MRKWLFFILLLVIGCNSVKDNQKSATLIGDLNSDFPIADTIHFHPKHSFEINSSLLGYNVSDSVLWLFERNPDRFGICYNINTGEKISTILNKSRASNEINMGTSHLYNFSRKHWNNIFFGDSIQILLGYERAIKMFSRKDILNNIPMSERGFSIAKMSDSIFFSNMIKLPTGAIIGVIDGLSEDNGNGRFFMSENGQITQFGEFRKDLYEPENTMVNMTTEILRGWTSDVFMLLNNNKVAVIGDRPFSFNIVDVDKKSICIEKYYDKMVIGENSSSGKSMIANTYAAGCTDQYIFCFTEKCDHKRTKDGKVSPDEFIVLVFDWDLNPIKKFYLNVSGMKNNFKKLVRFSENCEKIYCLLEDDETLQLMEGELSLNIL